MYISNYTLNYSQFSTKIFDFFGTPSYWYFLISSVQWQFLTRCKKTHAISINTESVRSSRVETFWWHSSNRNVRPGEFQPYMSLQQLSKLAIFQKLLTWCGRKFECRFLRTSRTDSNCDGDICMGIICSAAFVHIRNISARGGKIFFFLSSWYNCAIFSATFKKF